jgi:HPt (histidine-containing phosphotransfer) domain-containing protein
MYYGYNNNKQLIMADKEFIELLGYHTFNDLINQNVLKIINFKDNKIHFNQTTRTIQADYQQHEVYYAEGTFYLLELENIVIQNIKKAVKTPLPLQVNYEPIYLNVNKISDEIGLSVDDYKLYLDSFIDQSIIDEKRLLQGDDKVIKNLSNLAMTLKIPHINILLLKIQKVSQSERIPLIDQYYTKLALLTLEEKEVEKRSKVMNLFEEDNDDENKDKEDILSSRFTDLLSNVHTKNDKDESLDLFSDEINLLEDELTLDLEEEEPLTLIPTPVVSPVHTQTKIEPKLYGDVKEISLDNVPALPINYDPKTAADELNLPVVLIEEFVEDFIEQARQDKDHLLTSYYQKDMDNIHELGHKLKGAASNLRINELSDILEDIQFCTEHSRLEMLFIKYWGHFLSLEDYMNQLKKS